MLTRTHAIKLTLFLLLIAGLALGLVVLFVGTSFREPSNTYYLRVPDSVYGLEEGATVNLHGVRIGRVSSLDLAEDNTEVDVALEVDPKIRIPSDAEAGLKYRGLTGLKFIDIVGGSPGAAALEPGDHIRYRRSGIDALTKNAQELVTHAAHAFEQAGRLAEQLSNIVAQTDPHRADALLQRGEQLLLNLDRSAVELRRLLSETREPLRSAIADAGSATRRADDVLAGAEEALEGLELLIEDMSGVVQRSGDDVSSTTRNLRQTSQYLEDLARRLRERPSRILFDRPPSERELP